MSETKLVIFDCDGVLVDSERLSFDELLKTLGGIGVNMSLAEAVPIFLGTSRRTTMKEICRLAAREIEDAFYDTFQTPLLARLRAELKPVAGIEKVLDFLEGRAIPYCVASSGDPEKIRTSLTTTGLLPRFEGRVFSAVQVKNGKPAPDLFLLAAKTCGADPRACVVVEDSTRGVQAAKAAGMRSIGFSDLSPASSLEQEGADTVISSYGSFQNALAKLNHR